MKYRNDTIRSGFHQPNVAKKKKENENGKYFFHKACSIVCYLSMKFFYPIGFLFRFVFHYLVFYSDNSVLIITFIYIYVCIVYRCVYSPVEYVQQISPVPDHLVWIQGSSWSIHRFLVCEIDANGKAFIEIEPSTYT